LCQTSDTATAAAAAGKLLVRFYGEHSSSWAAPKQLSTWGPQEEGDRLEGLRQWGKRANK
jgi:hypothetical protein